MRPEGKVLYSWKEIADCLGVTVRSAQRWEKECDLPIHRQGSGSRARVFAYESELIAWREKGEGVSARIQEEDAAATAEAALEGPWKRLRNASHWGIGALALASAVLLFDPGLVPALREPAEWRFLDKRLTVMDAKGRICWEKQFPGSVESTADVVDVATIQDVDGDGGVEILFNYAPVTRGAEPGVLYCYDRRGQERWRFSYGRARKFGDREFDPFYFGRMFRVVRFGGQTRVITVANHQVWYPAQAALIDARTGRLLEEYWHPGAIHKMLLTDLDGDGEQELLLGAINNPGVGLGHPGLAVLRLPFSKRREPGWGGRDGFEALTGGGEAAYAVFPTPDLNDAAGVFPFFANLAMDDRHRVLVQLALPEQRSIGYYLNRKLDVDEFRLTDDYAALHHRFRVQGLLDHELDSKETARLGQVFVLTNAPPGNAPEVRRLWQEGSGAR